MSTKPSFDTIGNNELSGDFLKAKDLLSEAHKSPRWTIIDGDFIQSVKYDLRSKYTGKPLSEVPESDKEWKRYLNVESTQGKAKLQLNSTHIKYLMSAISENPSQWFGATIVLFKVAANGKESIAINVLDSASTPTQSTSKPLAPSDNLEELRSSIRVSLDCILANTDFPLMLNANGKEVKVLDYSDKVDKMTLPALQKYNQQLIDLIEQNGYIMF